MNRFRYALVISLLMSAIALLGIVGCAGTQTNPRTSGGPGADAESRLRIGDQIQIRVETSSIQAPQVYDLMVDEVGEIALPLIDRIKADGLTSSDLAERIRASYVPRYYLRCNVNVLVASRFFYVAGEARGPGRYPWTKDVTLLKAISTAGGFSDYANRGSVELTRGKEKTNYNCESIRQHPENDVAIQPGDSIYIPRSIF